MLKKNYGQPAKKFQKKKKNRVDSNFSYFHLSLKKKAHQRKIKHTCVIIDRRK